MLLWQFYVAGNNETYVRLHVSAQWCIATEDYSFADGLL